MAEENISQAFRLKNIDETRNYLIEETNQNELMSKKQKKVFRVLNYLEHVRISISKVSRFPISAFASVDSIPTGICNRIKKLCNNCRN